MDEGELRDYKKIKKYFEYIEKDVYLKDIYKKIKSLDARHLYLDLCLNGFFEKDFMDIADNLLSLEVFLMPDGHHNNQVTFNKEFIKLKKYIVYKVNCLKGITSVNSFNNEYIKCQAYEIFSSIIDEMRHICDLMVCILGEYILVEWARDKRTTRLELINFKNNNIKYFDLIDGIEHIRFKTIDEIRRWAEQTVIYDLKQYVETSDDPKEFIDAATEIYNRRKKEEEEIAARKKAQKEKEELEAKLKKARSEKKKKELQKKLREERAQVRADGYQPNFTYSFDIANAIADATDKDINDVQSLLYGIYNSVYDDYSDDFY